MNSHPKVILELLAEDDGATAVEYAVMLALIVAVCVGSVSFLATKTAESFDTSANAISGAFAN
jgi:pilus assembly protein Flp/PilA